MKNFLCALLVLTGSPLMNAQTVLYATGAAGLFIITPGTGAIMTVGTPSDANIDGGGLTYDPLTATLYATGYDNASRSAFYTLNRGTGAATKVAQIPVNISISSGGLAFDTTNRVLYATGTEGHQGTVLFSLNPANGAITPIGTQAIIPWQASTSPVDLYGLGHDPRTDTLYANGYILFDSSGLGSSLFTINRATGEPTWIGYTGVTLGRSLSYSGLAYDLATDAFYSLGSITGGSEGLYTVNTMTGLATLVSTQAPRIGVDGGLAFIAIPEPSACAALAGLAALVFMILRTAKPKSHLQS